MAKSFVQMLASKRFVFQNLGAETGSGDTEKEKKEPPLFASLAGERGPTHEGGTLVERTLAALRKVEIDTAGNRHLDKSDKPKEDVAKILLDRANNNPERGIPKDVTLKTLSDQKLYLNLAFNPDGSIRKNPYNERIDVTVSKGDTVVTTGKNIWSPMGGVHLAEVWYKIPGTERLIQGFVLLKDLIRTGGTTKKPTVEDVKIDEVINFARANPAKAFPDGTKFKVVARSGVDVYNGRQRIGKVPEGSTVTYEPAQPGRRFYSQRRGVMFVPIKYIAPNGEELVGMALLKNNFAIDNSDSTGTSTVSADTSNVG